MWSDSFCSSAALVTLAVETEFVGQISFKGGPAMAPRSPLPACGQGPGPRSPRGGPFSLCALQLPRLRSAADHGACRGQVVRRRGRQSTGERAWRVVNTQEVLAVALVIGEDCRTWTGVGLVLVPPPAGGSFRLDSFLTVCLLEPGGRACADRASCATARGSHLRKRPSAPFLPLASCLALHVFCEHFSFSAFPPRSAAFS